MICVFCREVKDLTEFSPSATAWPDRPQWCKPCNRALTQINRHGITSEQKAEIAAHQGGCRICGHPEPGREWGWVVDHDHACCGPTKSCHKCRRGVICAYCNTMLGNAFDRIQTLTAAIAYLDAPRTCDWHMPLACAPRICGNEGSA